LRAVAKQSRFGFTHKDCFGRSSLAMTSLFVLLIPFFTKAQLKPEIVPLEKTASEKYLFPINPGTQNWLAGSMGELRATHFHAGIDIRTNNMVGLPVRATQRGYISYIIVSPVGYGNALFITHPDGNISVYGHLDEFKGKVADYVLNEHYKKKSFDLVLAPEANQFPVNQGDTIALSGNTGGSQGPHLHFEIRDANNEALNPLKFNFSEIQDSFSPVVQKIALTTLDIHSRINGKFGRVEFFVLRNGNNYTVPMPVEAHGKIGVEILAHDKMDLTQFRCGINYIEMLSDSQKVFSQKIEKINFLRANDIVALMNYPILKTRGVRFNKLYVVDGNPLKYYESGKGEINITNKPANVQVNLFDSYGNKSQAFIKLIPDKESATVSLPSSTLPFSYEINENVLVLQTNFCAPKSKAVFYEKDIPISVEPTYEDTNQQVYLFDLRKNIPDSAQTCRGTVHFNITAQIPSNTEYTYYSDWTDIHFHKNSLYDTLYLNLSKEEKNGSTVYTIGRNIEPLNKSIEIILKQLKKYIINDSKVSVYHKEGRANEFIRSRWENGNIHFNTAELGDFVLLKDSIAPFIHRVHCNTWSARFKISDDLSGIDKYEAIVNGEWLMMKYDYKTGIIQSEKLDKTKPLKGDFVLKVTDRVGNIQVYRQKIL